MKKIAMLLKSNMLILGLILSTNVFSQVTIDYEDFESGWGIWNRGGSGADVHRRTNDNLPTVGTSSIRIRDNSGANSRMRTDRINLTAYTAVDFTFDFEATSMENDEKFFVRYYDGSNWHLIGNYISGTNFNNGIDYNITISLDNTYTFATNSRFSIQCNASNNNDHVHIDNILIEGYSGSAPEIDVTGLTNLIIGDGSNTPSTTDNTDFGTLQVPAETTTNTFVIENTGISDLTLGTISLTGPSDFTIDSSPSSGTTIPAGGSANIVVSFTPSSGGTQTEILNIASDDSDEPNYQINLIAIGEKIFYDSDGDGIYDDVDIDDDNDGISDSDEENDCRAANGSSLTDYKFLNETFGTGTARSSAISTLYTATTSYCLEDGDASVMLADECDSNTSVNDGEYTIASFITTGSSSELVGPTGDAVASWAWFAWAPIEDHTPGDTDGKMAIFNADYTPGTFYETQITGTLINVPITYSFWVINLDNADAAFSGGLQPNGHRILPEITVNFLSVDKNTTLATFNTGPITRCSGDTYIPSNHVGAGVHDPSYNICATSEWKQFTQQFTTSETAFIVQFVNTAPGGGGNDLAIDDIEIRQTLCDMDGDMVANIFDLDSDDDGIPDAVEANPTSASLSQGKGTLTGLGSWTDVSGSGANGMHDATEGITPVDTDGDGIPDYLDLDSDNDGIFDIDESGATNTNDTNFKNGDGDRSGNGIGNGPDTETFREKDSDGDGIIEGYGDGILDIFDFHEGNTNFTDSYGNNSQGTAPLYTLDSDGDGIPDYKDPYNNTTSTYDIDTVEIYASLPHTAGVLDSTTDADGDGIMASRDGDDTIVGSPRNLDGSYHLYFDGRNDYIEDTNLISAGSATLMGFVKHDGANTNNDDQIIVGQSDFYIAMDNATNTIKAVVEGITLYSTTTLPNGIWTHVALTTESGGDTVLYINGVQEAIDISGSGGIASISNFMIGRATTNNNYFKGDIEEVRVFSIALTSTELKRMVYQELDETNGFNSGKIIPTNISGSCGSNLVKYYKMDGYQGDILDNKKTGTIDTATGAKMYNFKNIYFQTAPLPYVTNADGNWTDSASWLHGGVWDITSKQDNPDDASIVHIKHNITLNGTYDTQGTAAIIVDSGKEFLINTNKGLYNSWYIQLHGDIDLEGESQLIQTDASVLDVTSSGTLERDQQGNSNTYLYNYWSSPVGTTNTTTNNNSYTLPTVITNVGFLTSGYNGNASPVKIADYWIWKYANLTGETYSLWQHVRSTGTLLAGEGFTMKGPGTATANHNYILKGKPNNGDFTLTLGPGNEYLIGNPYPSAIDANEFILDNIGIADGGRNTTGNVINGALYFWDHFSNNTHRLSDYEGGYAIYTLIGGTAAISNDVRINASGAIGTKIPERYIPVAQGFFVSAIVDAGLVGLIQPVVGGDIEFKNSQRVFKKEHATGTNTGSLFIKNGSKTKSTTKNISQEEEDPRPKIRLNFHSPNGYHRQLLVGSDPNTTNDFDLGYDAQLTETNNEDIYWLLNDSKFIIQGVNNFNDAQTLPIGIKTNIDGISTIKIEDLQNIDDETSIYLHDKTSNTYFNLKESSYSTFLQAGEYLNRFEITFNDGTSKQLLGTKTVDHKKMEVYFYNKNKSIIINNPALKKITSVNVYNTLGQSILKFDNSSNTSYLEFKAKQIKIGTYIVKVESESGSVSKKIIIN